MNNITNTNTNTTETTTTEVQSTETKTYTHEEVMKMLQSETDRRVQSALNKQQKKFEQKLSEAEKLREMDENEREAYKFKQEREEFEQQKREFALMQNKLEASKVLSQRGLPVEFVDYIVAEDADTMLENITVFETAFNAAVNDAVAKKISTPSPKTGNVAQTGLNKEGFKAMSIAERSRLYETNPTLYKQLSK